VRAQNDAIVPALPIPPPPELERRFERGRRFEVEIVAELQKAVPRTVVVHGRTTGEVEQATEVALAQRAQVIVGGRLQTDTIGRRAGKPDVLVAAPGGGYRPVDIKHHLTLETAIPDRRGLPSLISRFATPAREDAALDEFLWARKRNDDLLQLAHYQRILEAAGLAPDDGRWAGIIGVERQIVWFDLDAAIWKKSAPSQAQQWRSTMDVYDVEFDFRLDVIAAAVEHERDSTVELLATPVKVGECAECPWWDYCRAQLESGPGDVSLLPRVGWREWRIHRDHGVSDRAALARLDPRTARLVSAGVDLPELHRLVEGLPDETPVRELNVVVRAKSQLDRLEQEGVQTFGGLMQLDPTTASYAGTGMSSLPDQIDLARASLGPSTIYRRRGLAEIVVPRADVEVDVDMENVEDGVYLWGALVTVRMEGSPRSQYQPWVTWEPLTADVEAQNSLAFWTWLMEERRQAHEQDRTFRAYCYNASAENTYLKRLGLAVGLSGEVTAFIQSEEWVDLLRTVDQQLITGGSSGLKAIAPLTGFHWNVDDPGGGLSMLKYDIAVSSDDDGARGEARDWLLTYNRGDVEATLAIRNWLETAADRLPSIESLNASNFETSGVVS
jgi:predicted RecB family nuclease